MFDYEFKTTFWSDFSIADRFGVDAIMDTYRRAFNEWKDDYVYLTELVLVLNWKIGEHYKNGNTLVASVYDQLWRNTSEYACENLKGEELRYYFRTTN